MRDRRTCDCLEERYSPCDTLGDRPEFEADPDCPRCKGTGMPDDDGLPEAPAVWAEHRARVREINRTCMGIMARLVPGMGGHIPLEITHEDTQEGGLSGLNAAKRERNEP